jgi:hypothetical protein
MRNPFRYFNSSPEVIRLTAMMYIRYPLSLRQVGDLLLSPRRTSDRTGSTRTAPFRGRYRSRRKRRVRHRSNVGVGSMTGPKTPISRSDEERAHRRNSGHQDLAEIYRR